MESEVEKDFQKLVKVLEKKQTNFEKFVKFVKFYFSEEKVKGAKYSERFFRYLVNKISGHEVKRARSISINVGERDQQAF